MSHTVESVRQKAAQLLRERGWCQFACQDGGRLCIVAAIRVAAGLPAVPPAFTETHDGIAGRVVAALRRQLRLRERPLEKWNNDDCTSTEQAIAALEGKA